jgi:iron complex transport system permease protein
LGDLGLAAAAGLGAGLTLLAILLVARRIQNTITILILGLMFGYLTNALVSLLIYFSLPERIQSFALWSAGSFGGVTWSQLWVFAPVIGLGLGLAALLPKSLNALLLGESYARTLGLNVRRARVAVIVSASLLAGVVTAFCGPVGFLGVATPHLCRTLFDTADHRVLVPTSMLLGGALALLADLIAQMPGSQYVLPLNVITSFFGVPVILWVVLRQRQLKGAFA